MLQCRGNLVLAAADLPTIVTVLYCTVLHCTVLYYTVTVLYIVLC